MLNKEITNTIQVEGTTRKIQVKKREVVLTTFKEGNDNCCKETYKYTMYNTFNKTIVTIVTDNLETIIFNIDLCIVIANIPELVKVECYKIIDQIFIKIIGREKQSIYDEKSNLLETETKYDMEVIYGGCGPSIKKTHKQTGKTYCVELC